MVGVEVEQAIELILNQVKPIVETEEVNLLDSLGRILAVDLTAMLDNPPFDRSPVDGYALRSMDIAAATKDNPITLKVIEELTAGDYPSKEVGEGEAVRIMTGAPIPAGADCTVYQEVTDSGEIEVKVYQPVGAYINYCYKGEDFKKGTVLLKKGMKVGSTEIGVIASMGLDKVCVYRKPRLALFVTGDEVMLPGQPLLPGKIYNSNLFMVLSRLKELNMEAEYWEQVPDDAGVMAAAIEKVLPWADAVITTGGVSVGKKDIIHEVLPILGAKRIFWRVNLKPGTPTIFSVKAGVPILSLSGNPFGAIANVELLLRPMLSRMCQDISLEGKHLEAVMADEFLKESKGRRYIRGMYDNGIVKLPSGLHSSGVLSSMQGCNCLVDIAPGTKALYKGDKVKVVLL